MRYEHRWKSYVSVGQRMAKAHAFAAKIAKKQKRTCQPIQIEGRKIAKSFWGKAWCDHVVSLSDYANRLPRGRTYVRNGSVVDLVIKPGKVEAIVAGSEPYKASISIKKLDKKTWDAIKKDCSSSIDSLIDLLGGHLSEGVMRRLTKEKSGCFPTAQQIKLDCSCPDWSVCCKHVAAVMYGIGSRLDSEPGLLFLLRGVNQEELISQAVSQENLSQEFSVGSNDFDGEDLGAMFGIDLDSAVDAKISGKRSKSKRASGSKGPRKKTATAKKSAKTKPAGTKIKSSKAKKAKKKSKRKPTEKATSTNRKTKVTKKTNRKKKVTKKKSTAAIKTARKSAPPKRKANSKKT